VSKRLAKVLAAAIAPLDVDHPCEERVAAFPCSDCGPLCAKLHGEPCDCAERLPHRLRFKRCGNSVKGPEARVSLMTWGIVLCSSCRLMRTGPCTEPCEEVLS
jgi:hypothetical protein